MVDWLVGRWVGRFLLGRSVSSLAGWLVGWLAGWLVDWLIVWQVVWLDGWPAGSFYLYQVYFEGQRRSKKGTAIFREVKGENVLLVCTRVLEALLCEHFVILLSDE